MGMDIYGKKFENDPASPKYEGCKTDAEREAYWKWQDETPGVYFRSNIWGWGPLLQFIEATVAASNLGFDTHLWAYNDGAGLENQEQCDALANAMEDMLLRVSPGQWTATTPVASAMGAMLGVNVPATLDTKRVQRFIRFLRHCGGFAIY